MCHACVWFVGRIPTWFVGRTPKLLGALCAHCINLAPSEQIGNTPGGACVHCDVHLHMRMWVFLMYLLCRLLFWFLLKQIALILRSIPKLKTKTLFNNSRARSSLCSSGAVQVSLGNTLDDIRHDCNQHNGWIGSNAMLEPKIQRMLNWVVWYLVHVE